MVETPTVHIQLLHNKGRRSIGWKYLIYNPVDQQIRVDEGSGSTFQLYSTDSDLIVSPEGSGMWLSVNEQGRFYLSPNVYEAVRFPAGRANLLSNSALSIEMSDLSSSLRQALAILGSFGLIMSLQNKPVSQKMAVQFTGTGVLDPNILTQSACEAINAYWDPIQQSCFTCKSGLQYPDRTNLTCIDCKVGAQCGDNGGFCKGETGNPEAVCLENSTTKKYSAACTDSTGCGGQCSGDCGASGVFGWTCQYDSSNKTYGCKFDRSRWWVMFLWILLFLIILILLIGLVVWLLKPKKTSTTVVVEPPPSVQVPVNNPSVTVGMNNSTPVPVNMTPNVNPPTSVIASSPPKNTASLPPSVRYYA